jgi:hypothetical protein
VITESRSIAKLMLVGVSTRSRLYLRIVTFCTARSVALVHFESVD